MPQLAPASVLPANPTFDPRTLEINFNPAPLKVIDQSKSAPGLRGTLTPRSNLIQMREGARRMQSAFRRKRWHGIISVLSHEVFVLFGIRFRPLIGRNSELIGVRGPSGRWYVGHAFGCMHAANPLRRVVIALVEAPAFEVLSMLAIMLNCLVLAVVGRPSDSMFYLDQPTIELCELAFTCLFTFELLLKSLAMGIFTDQYHALLSDPWNRLDLAVVLSAWLPLLLPFLTGYTSLRALRAFRPLRMVNHFPGVRKQINTISRSLPSLLNVTVLLAFVIAIFSVLGMQLFKGALLYRCYELPDGIDAAAAAAALAGPDSASRRLLEGHLDALLERGLSEAGPTAGGMSLQPLDPMQGVCSPYGEIVYAEFADAPASAATCPSHQACLLYGKNPNHGTVSFDNFFAAAMTVFMCITGEGWTDAMYLAMQGYHPAAAWYFVLLTLFGSFYVVNLFLAVLWEVYSKEGTKDQEVQKKLDLISDAHGVDYEASTRTQEKAAKATALALKGTNGRLGGRATAVTVSEPPAGAPAGLQRAGSEATQALLLSDRRAQMKHFRMPSRVPSYKLYAGDREYTCLESLAVLIDSREFRLSIMALIVLNISVMMFERFDMPAWQRSWMEAANLAFVGIYTIEMLVKMLALGCSAYWQDAFNRFDGLVVSFSLVDVASTYLVDIPGFEAGQSLQIFRAFRLLRVFKLARNWGSLYSVIRSIVNMLGNLQDLLLVLLLLIFVFALLAMQLFGGHVVDFERDLFDSIEHAMVTVFIIVTGENWNTLWMQTQEQLGDWTAAYYVVLVSVGDYIVMNLVISVVISSVVEGEISLKVQNEWDADEWHLGEDVGCFGLSCASCLRCEATRALGLFGEGNWIRRLCTWLLQVRLPGTPLTLEAINLVNITATAILVAMEGGCAGHTAADSTWGHAERPLPEWLREYLLVTLLISLAEIACKVVANGLLFSETAYLRNGWHQIDALIAVLCVGEIFDGGMGGNYMGAVVLRSVHVLRPIRLIARLPGLRQVIALLVNVMPRVVNILLVYCLFMVVFAVLGVQIFSGKFGTCPADLSQPDKASCLAAGHAWRSSPHSGSFDNILSACLYLFEISSLEGWPTAMYLGADAVGIDQSPQTDFFYVSVLYFIAWIILGAFVVLNVFVGVLIDTFAKMNDQQRYGGILTDQNQQDWIETLETMTQVRPIQRQETPRPGLRACFYKLVTHARFEYAIMCVILFNSLLMAFDSYGLHPYWHGALDAANDACSAVFVLEALLKLLALGVPQYFGEPWNCFDFFVVLVAIAEFVFKAVAGDLVKGSLLRVARVARAARVLRAFRAVKQSRSIRSLLTTLLYSILPLGNILGVFVIVTFIFAVLGMELFGGVVWGEYLNAEANFCSFETAMLTMFRCATGEEWNGIMHDAMASPEDSDCDPQRNCGSWLAIPFFSSYVILTTFIVLKMMVALIIENFKLSMREDTRYVRPADRDAFMEVWALFDPKGTGRVVLTDLHQLIKKLEPPLGLRPTNFRGAMVRDRNVTNFILSLEVDTITLGDAKSGLHKYVRFHDLLLALTTKALESHKEGVLDSRGVTHKELLDPLGAPAALRPGQRSWRAGMRPDADGSTSFIPSESLAHVTPDVEAGGLAHPVPLAATSAATEHGSPHHARPATLQPLGSLHSLFLAKAKEMRAKDEHTENEPTAPGEAGADAGERLRVEYATQLIQSRWKRKKDRRRNSAMFDVATAVVKTNVDYTA